MDSSAMRRHRRSHLRDKPFKCDLCPKQYGNKATLRKHKKTMHEGDAATMVPVPVQVPAPGPVTLTVGPPQVPMYHPPDLTNLTNAAYCYGLSVVSSEGLKYDPENVPVS